MRPPKLSDRAIEEIRTWAAIRRSLPTGKQLAAKYGICEVTVSRIANGYEYKKIYTQAELNQMAESFVSSVNVSRVTEQEPGCTPQNQF